MLLCFSLFSLIFSLPNDPMLNLSFPLNNNGIFGSARGEDINILSAWNNGFDGSNLTISIVGGGCYVNNDELKNRQISSLHYNIDDGTTNVEPSTESDDQNYTSLAAMAVAKGNNSFCSVGAAYKSSFFYLKTERIDDDEVLVSAITKYDENADIKYFSFVPRCSSDSKCPPPVHHYEVEKAIAESNAIIVTPAGADAMRGGDANLFTISKSPFTITVADTTASGTRAFWSNRGSSILANAPAGGSLSYYNTQKYFPSSISMGKDQCLTENSGVVIGSGAAFAAGVLALMKQANSRITSRDAQAIIILSSTINDPYSLSWVLNGAGFNYSDIYGFGRINANLAIEISKKWENLPQQETEQIVFQSIELLEARSGFSKLSSQYNGNLHFIECVELEFECENPSMLTIFITSPMGTTHKIATPYIPKEKQSQSYYVAKGFFAEDPTGNWNLSISHEGFSNKLNISNIKLNIVGMKNSIFLPSAQRNIGSDSFQPLHNDIEFTLSTKNLKCDDYSTLSLTSPANEDFDVFLRHDDHSLYHTETTIRSGEQSAKFKIPCIFKSNNYSIYVENRKTDSSGSLPVFVENSNDDSIILNPTPYDTLYINESGMINIDLQISLRSDYLITDATAHSAIVGIYDLINQKNIYNRLTLLSDFNAISVPVENTVKEGILYVVPLWFTNTSGCSSLIQPIFIIHENEDEPEKFEVPLSNNCPIPTGVDDEDYPKPDSNLRIIWISCIGGFSVIFMVTIVVWHCTCRKKSSKLNLDQATLFESHN